MLLRLLLLVKMMHRMMIIIESAADAFPYIESTPHNFRSHQEKLIHIIKDGNYPPTLYQQVMEWARECEAKTWGKDLTKAQLLQKSAFTSQHYQTVSMRNMIHFYFPDGILKPKVILVQHSQLRPVNV